LISLAVKPVQEAKAWDEVALVKAMSTKNPLGAKRYGRVRTGFSIGRAGTRRGHGATAADSNRSWKNAFEFSMLRKPSEIHGFVGGYGSDDL
jgi:hypothetical protein